MNIFLTDTLQTYELERKDNEPLMLCSYLKEFGGGLTPNVLLLSAAVKKQKAPIWLVVRDEPERPCQIDWLKVINNAQQMIQISQTLNPNCVINCVCPVPMKKVSESDDRELTLNLSQENPPASNTMNLYADPTVYLLRESDWKLLPSLFKGVCWPLIGLTEEEVLAQADRGEKLAKTTGLSIIFVPYHRYSPPKIYEGKHACLIIPSSISTFKVRGEALPWQEHGLVTNLFSLPLKVAAHH